MTIQIPAAYDGRLLRSYLKLTLGLSTAVLAKLKNREDGILVNGQRVTVRYVLREGDILTLGDRDNAETATERVLPVEHPLDVLYEDDYLIALGKPAGMPTHPSRGHLTDTLANALAYRYQAADEPFVFRPLGRLDRNTSGVVVVGKTRAAAGCLFRSLQAGWVRKRYVAILVGEIPEDGETHVITAPIYRPDAAGIRRAVGTTETPGAFFAETRYRVLRARHGHTLVLCEPVTGRTHQLRVHFSHMGYPLLGDDIYGAPEIPPSTYMERHALHALTLSVPLPFFGAIDGKIFPSSQPTSPSTPLALPLDCPLNALTDDGYLHAYAPLPADLAEAAVHLFGMDTVACNLPRSISSELPFYRKDTICL